MNALETIFRSPTFCFIIHDSLMLLIITNDTDVHPNPVIENLNKSGLPLFRLNTDKLVSDYDISYWLGNDGAHFEIRYKHYPHSINSEQISCVWERRPIEPLTTYDDIPSEQVRKLLLDEADGFVRFFRYALPDDLLWIGHPLYERAAGSKILQKKVARKVGFNIPDTLFSNRLSDLSLFGDSDVAVKPIWSFDIPAGDEGSIVFYTHKRKPDDIRALGDASFRNSINFIEKYVEKKYELRVTVINDECFTARIDSQNMQQNEGAVDWRQGYDHGITFVKDTLPNELQQKCFEFLKEMKLNFGCFDFIVDTHDNYIFLECNTNGQWMWLEEEAGLPISQKLSDLFANEIRKKQANKGQR